MAICLKIIGLAVQPHLNFSHVFKAQTRSYWCSPVDWGGGLKNVSEYSEWSMWATDTSLKNLSEIIYPTDKRLLVGACINSFLYLTISPIICIKQFFVSFQSLMSSASNKSSKKKIKTSVSLCWPNIKRDHYKGWTVLPRFTLPAFLLAETMLQHYLLSFPPDDFL